MEPALQRRIQRYGWDKAASYYETFWVKQLKPAQDLLLEMVHLEPGEKVLESACGTGLVSFHAGAKVTEKGFVWGTDISQKMVEIAEALALDKKISHIKFERMDAEELTMESSFFDVAICALGLMYVPDPLKALQEMFRVLKPGGRATAAVWGQRVHCGWADIFEIVDKRVASEVCPMFFNLGNPQMLVLTFKAAGFSQIREEKISTILHYDTAAQACGAAFAGGPVALAYNKFSAEEKEEVHKEYLSSIDRYKKNGGYEVPGEFVVAIGFK
ncbi:MAG TPA: methyltransferase domain-containing protein [Puia sp.]|jgi:ubiquinone/menaquinone biosynthesis C-methylase UbiE|nr:methyltransferase domain-containing protein [Puia sp.]